MRWLMITGTFLGLVCAAVLIGRLDHVPLVWPAWGYVVGSVIAALWGKPPELKPGEQWYLRRWANQVWGPPKNAL